MRMMLTIGCFLFVVAGAVGQDTDERPAMRYGLNAHMREFPQGTPKEALASVIHAMEDGRIDYLLAQLSDPVFVDNRVKQVYGGKFEDLMSETRTKLNDNPAVLKELRRFLQDGEWQIADTKASVQLKDVKSHQVYLKKIEDRWFFENKQSTKDTKE